MSVFVVLCVYGLCRLLASKTAGSLSESGVWTEYANAPKYGISEKQDEQVLPTQRSRQRPSGVNV